MTRSSTAAAYDDDFFAWTQEQAAALRRASVAAAGDDIDLAHVAEEIEDLGKRDLLEVISYLARLLEHLIKIDFAPASLDAPHWRGEAINFQVSAVHAFSPGMRRLIDVNHVWRLASKRIEAAVASGLLVRMPETCPFEVDELLADEFDLDAALRRIQAARAPDRRL